MIIVLLELTQIKSDCWIRILILRFNTGLLKDEKSLNINSMLFMAFVVSSYCEFIEVELQQVWRLLVFLDLVKFIVVIFCTGLRVKHFVSLGWVLYCKLKHIISSGKNRVQ